MTCTKCEWSERVRAGAFKGRPWEETPCARCRLREDSTGTLEYDEERLPIEEGYQGGKLDGDDPLLPASVLADTLRLFLALPRDALDVLHLRYGGMPYREIAAKLGVGAAAVEVRHKRMIERSRVSRRCGRSSRPRRGNGRQDRGGRRREKKAEMLTN